MKALLLLARALSASLPSPPGGLAVDGSLKEWASLPPFAVLDGTSQVAGKEKPTGKADIQARVWLAQDEGGLVLAAMVTDDVVLVAQGAQDLVRSDHLELWLSLPPADLPPIGYAHQFGHFPLARMEDCDTPGDFSVDGQACHTWWKEQSARHKRLARAFTRQYVITPGGIQETWAAEARLAEPRSVGGEVDKVTDVPGAPSCCGSSRVEWRANPGGYVVEARIAVDDWPATAAWPIADARVLVDLVDNDQGRTGQETFLSSVPGRKFADPATFTPVTLPVPVAVEVDPPRMATLLTAPRSREEGWVDDVLFWYPTRPTPLLYAAVNRPIGYQYQPSYPSPTVTPVDLGRARRVASGGGVEVWEAPLAGPLGTWPWETLGLWTFRSPPDPSKRGQVVDLHGAQVVHVAPAPGGGWRVLAREDGLASVLGTGQCGACRRLSFALYTVSAQGLVEEACSGDAMEDQSISDGTDGRWATLVRVDLEWDPSLERVTLTGTVEGEGISRPWRAEYTWVGKGKCGERK